MPGKTLYRLLLVLSLAGLVVCVLGTLSMLDCSHRPPIPQIPDASVSIDASPPDVVSDSEDDSLPTEEDWAELLEYLTPLPDAFIYASADCSTIRVKKCLSTTRPPVEICLSTDDLVDCNQCLLRFLKIWPLDTIVCAVRSVDMTYRVASSSGLDIPRLQYNARMSRAWIDSEHFLIRN